MEIILYSPISEKSIAPAKKIVAEIWNRLREVSPSPEDRQNLLNDISYVMCCIAEDFSVLQEEKLLADGADLVFTLQADDEADDEVNYASDSDEDKSVDALIFDSLRSGRLSEYGTVVQTLRELSGCQSPAEARLLANVLCEAISLYPGVVNRIQEICEEHSLEFVDSRHTWASLNPDATSKKICQTFFMDEISGDANINEVVTILALRPIALNFHRGELRRIHEHLKALTCVDVTDALDACQTLANSVVWWETKLDAMRTMKERDGSSVCVKQKELMDEMSAAGVVFPLVWLSHIENAGLVFSFRHKNRRFVTTDRRMAEFEADRQLSGLKALKIRYGDQLASKIPPKEFLDEPIEVLELSNRSSGVLKRAGFECLGSLLSVTERDLMQKPGFGRQSLNEVRAIFSEMRVQLGVVSILGIAERRDGNVPRREDEEYD